MKNSKAGCKVYAIGNGHSFGMVEGNVDRSQSNAIYLKSITTVNPDTILNMTVDCYNKFKECHGTSPNWGPEGVYEFIASLFLSMHDKSVSGDIISAIDEVFRGNYTPLDFSNRMDNIVANSNIDYEVWSSSFRYLKNNVKINRS